MDSFFLLLSPHDTFLPLRSPFCVSWSQSRLSSCSFFSFFSSSCSFSHTRVHGMKWPASAWSHHFPRHLPPCDRTGSRIVRRRNRLENVLQIISIGEKNSSQGGFLRVHDFVECHQLRCVSSARAGSERSSFTETVFRLRGRDVFILRRRGR